MGIDISQDHLDIAWQSRHPDGSITEAVSVKIDNNAKGLQKLRRMLEQASVPLNERLLVVAENTGVYGRPLLRWCQDLCLSLHIGNATELNRSFGIARGKNDRVDALRLCDYALRQADRLRLMPPVSDSLLLLKDLYATRKRLIKDRSGHRVHLAALKKTMDAKSFQGLEKALNHTLTAITRSITLIEAQIKALVKKDEALSENYGLALSVPGVGPVTAHYLICCTLNFAIEVTGKGLACYGGVAPFGRQSGTSVRYKPRVHHMGNKELKKLLHQGARSIIQHKQEFRTYYDKKISEGKHELCVVNAVKNKILHRVAAVIRSRKKYVEKPPAKT